MKSQLIKDKKAVFGLTAVQQFFIVILGIALLAYVIVIIMGTLDNAPIIPTGTLSSGVSNESGAYINGTGYTLAQASSSSYSGFTGPSIIQVANATGVIAPGNYTLVGNTIYNATAVTLTTGVKVTYTFRYDNAAVGGADAILRNTSIGITGFFGAINPVYAILAVLVIILVLVVLVRVVSAPTSGPSTNPQL